MSKDDQIDSRALEGLLQKLIEENVDDFSKCIAVSSCVAGWWIDYEETRLTVTPVHTYDFFDQDRIK